MADGAWGCIMADEMGLGELLVPDLTRKAQWCRKDAAVHRPTVDTAQAVAHSRQAYVRKGNRSLSDIASRQLGQRARYAIFDATS